MCVIGWVISRSSTVQDAPGAIFSSGGLLRYPPFPSRRILDVVDPAIEHVRAIEDDVDAATPVDAKSAPTGVWKSRKEREIPTAPTSIIIFLRRRRTTTTKNKTTQINCPPNRIITSLRCSHRSVAEVGRRENV
jgi:hypothetical protein